MPIDTNALDNAVVELEELFGGYVGEGDLADEIRWVINEIRQERETAQATRSRAAQYQAEIVNICRDLGCKPDVAVSDPDYYGDMALEAIANLQAERDGLKNQASAFDPKGHVVLAEFGDRALVLTNKDAVQPFVVAHGYDSETGEWAHGLYFSDLGTAYDFANPEILEGAVVRIEREDISEKLKEYGAIPSYENIQEVIWPDTGHKALALSIHDNMLTCAREDIDARVKSLMDASRLDVLEHKDKEYSLSSEQRDLSRAKEVLASGREPDLQSRDER